MIEHISTPESTSARILDELNITGRLRRFIEVALQYQNQYATMDTNTLVSKIVSNITCHKAVLYALGLPINIFQKSGADDVKSMQEFAKLPFSKPKTYADADELQKGIVSYLSGQYGVGHIDGGRHSFLVLGTTADGTCWCFEKRSSGEEFRLIPLASIYTDYPEHVHKWTFSPIPYDIS
jgi:hypothetical protein